MKKKIIYTFEYQTLYRDIKNKKIAGVCAGLADYSSINVTLIRVLTVIGALTFSFVVIAAYIAGIIFLKPKPADLYTDEEDEEYWRRYRKSPRNTLAEARNKFRKLEQKLRKLETYVTSRKFNLDREFEEMDNGRSSKY